MYDGNGRLWKWDYVIMYVYVDGCIGKGGLEVEVWGFIVLRSVEIVFFSMSWYWKFTFIKLFILYMLVNRWTSSKVGASFSVQEYLTIKLECFHSDCASTQSISKLYESVC